MRGLPAVCPFRAYTGPRLCRGLTFCICSGCMFAAASRMHIPRGAEGKHHDEQRVQKHEPKAKAHAMAEGLCQLEIHDDIQHAGKRNQRQRRKGKRRLRLFKVDEYAAYGGAAAELKSASQKYTGFQHIL